MKATQIQIGKFYKHRFWPGLIYMGVAQKGWEGDEGTRHSFILVDNADDDIPVGGLVVEHDENPEFWEGFELIPDGEYELKLQRCKTNET